MSVPRAQNLPRVLGLEPVELIIRTERQVPPLEHTIPIGYTQIHFLLQELIVDIQQGCIGIEVAHIVVRVPG